VLKWINGYRSEPEPEKLPAAVKAMGEFGLLRELDQAGLQVGFIAGVLGTNPDKAPRLVAQMFPMPPEDQVILIKAIAFSGLPNWKQLLSAFSERMPARQVLIDKYCRWTKAHSCSTATGDITSAVDQNPRSGGSFRLWRG
jgi:hypothetical protein